MNTTAVSGGITNAINQIITILKNIANPVGILALVIIGIMLISSDDSSTIQKCKAWAVRIFIGMIIINLAPVIMSWIGTIGA